MNEKYKNKYRIKSHRMPGWDYAGNGFYFITIVTQSRECNLGEIINGKMILSDFGKIVETEWYESFEIRSELYLDEFVMMPNHLHSIVVLNNTNYHGSHVETHGRASLQSRTEQSPNRPQFVRKPQSISSFIGGFKSVVNTKIDDFIDENNLNIAKYNRNNHFFQSNYHDHIIRNDSEYYRIKNYIINNPASWSDDKFYE